MTGKLIENPSMDSVISSLESLKMGLVDSSYADGIGRDGVNMYASRTPVKTGLTRASWGYDTYIDGESTIIEFYNSNLSKRGQPIVQYLDKGHLTSTGGYVRPYNIIDPVTKELVNRFGLEIERRIRNG